MRLGKYLKTPDEIKRYSIEYKDWLDTGEYISNVSFSIVSTNTGTLSFVADTIQPSSTRMSFIVLGGVSGQNYEVGVTMTASTGEIKQDSILYSVRSL